MWDPYAMMKIDTPVAEVPSRGYTQVKPLHPEGTRAFRC